jgi:hypothetical protein
VRALAKLQGQAELTSNNLPQFYWFPDPANLQSARKIKPTEFASAIGDTAHLVSATVEMTRDPIVTDIDKTLPAYVAMTGPPYCGLYTSSRGFQLGAGAFLRPQKRFCAPN